MRLIISRLSYRVSMRHSDLSDSYTYMYKKQLSLINRVIPQLSNHSLVQVGVEQKM